MQDKCTQRLRPDRRETYPAAISHYVEQARPHMDVVWVALSDGFRLYADSATKPMDRGQKRELVQRLGLPPIAAEGHDDIMTKNIRGAFDAPSPLERHIRLAYPQVDTIDHAGMSTNVCIAQNIRGAAAAGFSNRVMYDLLADENILLRSETKPRAHLDWLKNSATLFDLTHRADSKAKLSFATSQDALRDMGAVPARPSLWDGIIQGFAVVARCNYRL